MNPIAARESSRPPENLGTGYSAALAVAHGILFLTCAGSLAWCLYSILAHKSDLYVRMSPAILGIASPLLLKFKPSVRIMVASVFIGAIAGLYAAQLFALFLSDPERPALQAIEQEAKKAGVPFDGRTRLEVIADLRNHGITAYPPFYPYLLLDSPLRIAGQPVVALSSLAQAMTVCCNDSGQFLTYKTDEHGFANPPGSWSAAPIDLAIVGASSAVGESVPPVDSLVLQLRKRFPNTVSLGAGGNGPLLELASVREYLPALKPKRVIWIFSESHTPEYLETESHSPLLLHYLDKSFRQGLLEKQDALNQAIARYFDEGIQTGQAEHAWTKMAKDFITLKGIRTVLYFYVTARTAKPKPFQFDAALYEKALREGQQSIGDWGGKVTLVYWPDSSRYAGICNYTPSLRQLYDHTHETVLNIASKLAIPVIDLSRSFPDLPASQSAQNTQYFYPYPAHFKPAGYHVAEQAILSSLEAQPAP